MKYIMLLLTALAVSPAFASGPQLDKYHEENGNAISICKGALPAYENLLRQRPLALANEGTNSSFVNCGYRAPSNSDGQEWFAARLQNLGAAGVTIRCTGVIGVEGDAEYVVKSVYVPGGQSRLLKWTFQQDYQNKRMNTNTGVQCLLPPSTAFTELPQGYRQR